MWVSVFMSVCGLSVKKCFLILGDGGAKVALSKSMVNIHQLLQRMLGQETWGLFPHLAPERGGPAECSSHHFLCCCSQLSNRVLILSVLVSEPKVPCAAHIMGLFFFRLSSKSWCTVSKSHLNLRGLTYVGAILALDVTSALLLKASVTLFRFVL